MAAVIGVAVKGGMNLVDLALTSRGAADNTYAALRRLGRDLLLVGHLGMDSVDGSTTRDLALCESSIRDLLKATDRPSVDVLMLHVVDKAEDCEAVFASGGLHDLSRRLRAEGRARWLGLSTHVVSIGLRAVQRGDIDVLMFPVNPAHDLIAGEAGLGAGWRQEAHLAAREAGAPSEDRRRLYQACEREGIGLLAIKTYAGGILLPGGRPTSFLKRTKLERGNASGITLTAVQCLSYALARPGVSSAVAGCRSVREVEAAAAYSTAGEAERDFSAIDANSLWKLGRRCVYCEHCLPCPRGIRIGALLRMLDAAEAGGAAAIAPAYGALTAQASDCTACGDCEARCPFGVAVTERLEKAAAVFGG